MLASCAGRLLDGYALVCDALRSLGLENRATMVWKT